jgi:nicotinamidase/pyrazinamidase
MTIKINEKDLLIIIDVQPDFMPGGKLAVADGDQVVPVINSMLKKDFSYAVATQDWHPEDHSSFASQHKGKAPFDVIKMPYGSQTLWNDHCIQSSKGAEIHKDLNMDKVNMIIRKGFRKDIDSYSAFKENDKVTETGLKAWITSMGFDRVFLCGLATDFCVANSAEDALEMNLPVYVIEDACRGIGIPVEEHKTTIDLAKENLSSKGVKFIKSYDLNIDDLGLIHHSSIKFW